MSGRVGSITTDIIADGLVFNIDAANRASTIPSTSTTEAFNTIDLSQSGSFSGNGIYDSSTLSPTLAFDTTNYITIGDHFNFEYNNPFTYSIWVYANAVNGTKILFSKYDSSSTKGYIMSIGSTYQSGPNRAFFALYNKGSGSISTRKTLQVYSPYDMTLNTWKNRVFTYDGNSLASGAKIYVNSILQSLTTSQDTLGSNTILNSESATIAKGNYYDGGYMGGNLGPYHIYNRALSANEVLHNYNALKGRFGL